jgi:aryl-alcohol dehydrogenase-like predicted oxidoreductase
VMDLNIEGDAPGVVLGAMNYGTTVSPESAYELLDRFVELGGRWIDTANCYSFWNDRSGVGGASERVLGRWLAARPGVRDRVLISTKVRQQPLIPHRWPESAEGLSAGAIEKGVRGSLERLGTDRVELLWAHAEDRSVDLSETVEAFGRLVTDGTVGRLGASNHAIWRVERARALAAELGVTGWSALQLRHTYVQPRPGVMLAERGHQLMTPEALDYAVAEPGIAVWAYYSLLNGSYVRPDRPLAEIYDHPGTTRRLLVLDRIAAELGATRNQVVLAWLLKGTPGISPIVGVSTVAQLDEAFVARELDLDEDQLRRMNEAN